MDIIFRFLPWLLPPLIGAAIGYITNAIAITMLFRPHNEKRVLSVRMPMTPGIIPKQRYELSRSVGNMVSRELLTEDAVRKQIRSKSFLKSIDNSLKTFLDLLIDTPFNLLKDKFIKSRLKIKTKGELGKSFLPELLGNFFDSSGFVNIINVLMDKGILYLEDKSVNQLFPDKRDRIINKLMSILLSPELEKKFINFADNWLEKAVHDNYHLTEILTTEAIGRVVGISSKLYKRLFPHFINFLEGDEIKGELEVHGRRLLKDILNKLNRIQRFLLSAGQYDKTLDENMMDIVDDTIGNLKAFGTTGKNIKTMEDGLKRRLISFSQTTAGQIVSGWDGDFFKDLHNLERSIFNILRNPVISDNIKKSLNSSYDKYGDLTIKVLLEDLFSLKLSDLKSKVISFLFPENKNPSYDKANVISSGLLSGIFNVVTGNGELPLENIIKISPELRVRINNSLTSTLIGIVDDKVPQILESIDVNTLVVDKINTLDMERVEKLILDIVRKQLRWINVFGAILGSIIGGAQLLVNMFM